MHDPMTVAFEIRRPWPEPSSFIPGHRYYPPIVTIWHVDPERDGSDDSCGWSMHPQRPWWRHPRWHIHHWYIQIHCILNLKRWLFSRCEGCGKRFPWGYAPTSLQWENEGPQWFRGERGVFHHECCLPMDAEPIRKEN